jgi:DNA-directed RNA polymerase specialized sigma subunit
MEDLDDRDRLILVMRYFDEAGFEEIARFIEGTEHQARALCHKAIRRLRTAMAEPDGRTLKPRTEVKR